MASAPVKKDPNFPGYFTNPTTGVRVVVQNAAGVPAGFLPSNQVNAMKEAAAAKPAPAKAPIPPPAPKPAPTVGLTRTQVVAALTEAKVAFQPNESLASLTAKLEEAAKAAA